MSAYVPAHGEGMNTTPKRVQAGIPTGGQFVPGAHDESDLALSAPTASAAALPVSIDLAAEDSMLSTELAQLRDLESRAELRATRLLAATVRAEYPQGKFIVLDWSDQGGRSMMLNSVLDANTEIVVDDPWEMECCDDATYLATCLTDDGAWEMAKDQSGLAPRIDIDRALALQVPAPVGDTEQPQRNDPDPLPHMKRV